ncbi:MAG: hypothetical protein ACSLE0_23785 [Chitinophagaceae bacterium]
MHPSPVAYMQWVMTCLLFAAHDAALSADRTNPLPRPLSVNPSPEKLSGLVIRHYSII